MELAYNNRVALGRRPRVMMTLLTLDCLMDNTPTAIARLGYRIQPHKRRAVALSIQQRDFSSMAAHLQARLLGLWINSYSAAGCGDSDLTGSHFILVNFCQTTPGVNLRSG